MFVVEYIIEHALLYLICSTVSYDDVLESFYSHGFNDVQYISNNDQHMSSRPMSYVTKKLVS